MSRRDLSLRAIFGLPVLIGVAALIGLIGALIWDGAWDGIGALLLAIAVGVVVWVRFRR